MRSSIIRGLHLPKVIYRTKSDLNGDIEILKIGKTIKLKVGGISQSINWDSPSCVKLVWGKVAELLKRETPNLKNVLILGLGGGTMQHLISHEFQNISIVSVELDPIMIEIAKKYYDIGSIPGHRVINANALRVVVEPRRFNLRKNSFGTLIVDIFIGEDYPDLGESGSFLGAVKELVASGGLVVFNRIYLESHQADVDNFIEQISEPFSDVKEEVVAGYTNSDNILVYGRV